MAGSEEITGVFDRFVWTKEDGSWVIGKMKSGVSFVGPGPADLFIRGVEYVLSGSWEEHNSYGRQFRYRTALARAPVTEGAVMSYLGKMLFGRGFGFGTVKARKVVAEVGPDKAMAVLKSNPEKVSEITGIALDKCRKISAVLVENDRHEQTRIQLVHLLDGYGFTQSVIDSAIKDFGVHAAERIRRDPFTMLVRGYSSAGFLRCDRLYLDLGLPRDRLKRQVICIWNLIRESSGSVWVDYQFIISEMGRLISSAINPSRAIELGVRARLLCRKKDLEGNIWISCLSDAICEKVVAARLLEMMGTSQDG